MSRKVFYSFHYVPDNWRVSQIRQIGAIEGNKAATDNDWESVTKGGDAAIKRWIDGQLAGKSCAIVLIGSATAGRRWIDYEIKKAWNDGKGVLGIHIHGLKDRLEKQASKGRNPFDSLSLGKTPLSKIARTYDPPSRESKKVYQHIQANISQWIEDAVAIRGKYKK